MARLEISKSALEFNLNYLCSKMRAPARYISILKDNAYGHDALLLAPLIKDFGINMIAVKNEAEARSLNRYFKDILILSQPCELAKYGPFIYAVNDLRDFNYLKNTRIMLKFNTGMNRSGIKVQQIHTAIKLAKDRSCELLGGFTHYSSPSHVAKQQAEYINCMAEYLKSARDLNMLSKQANSLARLSAMREASIAAVSPEASIAAVSPEAYSFANIDGAFFHSCASFSFLAGHFDIDNAARIGLAQFGYAHSNLRPIAKLYANLLSSRHLQPGDVVGYDEKFTATAPTICANYDLGYADGLAFYDGSWPLKISGSNVLGKFSMDSFSLDHLASEVCVFTDASLYADDFGINVYEALVRLSPSIKRVLVE